jgi:hypothetical protein
VRVGESYLGVRDLLINPPALDPRLERGASRIVTNRPTAVLRAPRLVSERESFRLDATGSRAAPGRTIERFVWMQLEEER